MKRNPKRACQSTPAASSLPKTLRRPPINLTHPEESRILTAPLARAAGGLELCGKPVWTGRDAPAYQAALRVIRAWHDDLVAHPREDMPGSVPCPAYTATQSKARRGSRSRPRTGVSELTRGVNAKKGHPMRNTTRSVTVLTLLLLSGTLAAAEQEKSLGGVSYAAGEWNGGYRCRKTIAMIEEIQTWDLGWH